MTLASALCGLIYVDDLRKAESLDSGLVFQVQPGFSGYSLILAGILLITQSFLFWLGGVVYKLDLQDQFSQNEVGKRSIFDRLVARIFRK